MIIDSHIHIFPDQAGPAGYPSVKESQREWQRNVTGFWGRMVCSHTDRKYAAEPDEDVGFTVGKYGRFQWRKHGEDCWLQRFAVAMEKAEHTPGQMLAHMDFVGVDMGVLQGGYMEPNWGRTYIADAAKQWPDRFIGTFQIQYDLTKDDEYLQGELRKVTHAVVELGHKGLYSHVPKDQPVDDPRCDPLWKEVARLGIPVFISTGMGARTKAEYQGRVKRLWNVCRKYPEMPVINETLGGLILPPNNPNYIDVATEMSDLLKLDNFYLEVGYGLAYENYAVWGRDYEYPYPRHEQLVRSVYEKFGAGVLVWGSDMPFTLRSCTYQQDLDLIRLHAEFMTEADRKLVMGDTIAKLFKVSS